MATKREQVLAALETLLNNATAVCSHIARERMRPWPESVSLALNIVPETDPRQETGGVNNTDRALFVDFQITSRGDQPTTLADPTVDALHDRLMSDRDLGGLAIDIEAGDNDFEWDDAERDECVIHQRYRITYRTSDTDIST